MKILKEKLQTVWFYSKIGIGVYICVAVAFFTLTITGETNKIPLYSPDTAIAGSSTSLGNTSYKQWRDAQAQELMKSESWREHMLEKAEEAVNLRTQEDSMSDYEKDVRDWNREMYGQDTMPESMKR